ncbi:MAG: prepilin peptidase [Patescibacteria group bacterium]|nr:prepilin peptidase [Patescibacteria group bacterium]
MSFVVFVYVFLFVIGLCLGSFLNVLIDRWPNDKSLKGRSHCDYCKKTLGLVDLIPVVSFIVLRGRCRRCHKKLSWQYPLVELGAGLLFVLTFYLFRHYPVSFGQTSFLIDNVIPAEIPFFNLLFIMVLLPFLIAIFMIDLKYSLILDRVIMPVIYLTLGFYVFEVFYYGFRGYHALLLNPLGKYLVGVNNQYFYSLVLRFAQPLIVSLAVGIFVALFFVLLIIISRGRGLGLGDIRLGFWLGLLLGYPKIITGLFLSFFLGGIAAFILLVLRRKKFGETVPLAPFLIIGTYISLFFGNQIITWYMQRFL